MEQNITLVAAFLAGVLSFLSPCVLPLLPTYTAVLSAGTDRKVGEKKTKGNLFINGVSFFSGFTLVFVIMGATASQFGQMFLVYQDGIRQVGAIFIVIMGLHVSGFLRVRALEREYRPLLRKTLEGPLGAFFLGIAFTTGWIPCVGPILASILVYAGTAATLTQGSLLLFVYAMGFSLPFLLMAVLLNRYFYQVRRFYPYLAILQQVAGVMLIIIGIVIYFDVMQRILGVLWP